MKARRWCAPIAVLLMAGLTFICVACTTGEGWSTGWGDGVSHGEGGTVKAAGTGVDDEVFFPIPSSEAVEVSLVRVIDGDTIRVRMPGGREEKVRYIGIDTPEVGGAGGTDEYLGGEATARNEELLGAGPILLETDVEERDRFGRLLAYVWADGVFVNGQLALEGYARVFSYKPNLGYQAELRAAQEWAEDKGIGIWSNRAPRR